MIEFEAETVLVDVKVMVIILEVAEGGGVLEAEGDEEVVEVELLEVGGPPHALTSVQSWTLAHSRGERGTEDILALHALPSSVPTGGPLAPYLASQI
jgi:hypothetical protein